MGKKHHDHIQFCLLQNRTGCLTFEDLCSIIKYEVKKSNQYAWGIIPFVDRF